MENLQTHKPRIEGMHLANNLQKGSSGDDAKYFQEELKQLGYYTGNIDGIFGPLTDTAARDFQTDYKLTVDGIIGPITSSKITEVISSPAIYQFGSNDVEVKSLQRQLKLLNLYPGNIDGIFGPVTDNGVKSFQQNNGLVQDGKVGLDTKQALQRKLLGEENVTESQPAVAAKDMGPKDETHKTVDQKTEPGKTYVTAEQMQKLGWTNVNDEMVKGLNNCLQKYDITTPERIRHFLSQCSQESGLGKFTEEQDPGYKYEGRSDLGNVNKGDGPKYKGAGYIQITGRNNYQEFTDDMGDPKIMDGADFVAEKYPWESAGFWWKMNDMNTVCDKGATVEEVTRRVNGTKMLGLQDRKKYYQKCLEIIK